MRAQPPIKREEGEEISIHENLIEKLLKIKVTMFKIKGTHLKMWAGNTLGNLLEKRLHNFNKLWWFDHIQYFLNFA